MQCKTTKLLKGAYWTAHAIQRCQQRGIRKPQVNIVFHHGDRELDTWGSCYSLSISDCRLKSLIKEGVVKASLAEKCKRPTVLTDGQHIITTYRTPYIN